MPRTSPWWKAVPIVAAVASLGFAGCRADVEVDDPPVEIEHEHVIEHHHEVEHEPDGHVDVDLDLKSK